MLGRKQFRYKKVKSYIAFVYAYKYPNVGSMVSKRIIEINALMLQRILSYLPLNVL